MNNYKVNSLYSKNNIGEKVEIVIVNPNGTIKITDTLKRVGVSYRSVETNKFIIPFASYGNIIKEIRLKKNGQVLYTANVTEPLEKHDTYMQGFYKNTEKVFGTEAAIKKSEEIWIVPCIEDLRKFDYRIIEDTPLVIKKNKIDEWKQFISQNNIKLVQDCFDIMQQLYYDSFPEDQLCQIIKSSRYTFYTDCDTIEGEAEYIINIVANFSKYGNKFLKTYKKNKEAIYDRVRKSIEEEHRIMQAKKRIKYGR